MEISNMEVIQASLRLLQERLQGLQIEVASIQEVVREVMEDGD